jgi:hypothetical protein
MSDRVQPTGHSNGILSTRETYLHRVCLEESGLEAATATPLEGTF